MYINIYGGNPSKAFTWGIWLDAVKFLASGIRHVWRSSFLESLLSCLCCVQGGEAPGVAAPQQWL